MLNLAIQQIIECFERARRILLVTHAKPDGDGLGAVCALKHYFEQKGIYSIIFCKTPAKKELHFLPYADQLTTNLSVFSDKSIDTVIALDAGDIPYLELDEELPKIRKSATIINIDHHPSNDYYGDINLVIPNATSTTEIIYQLFKYAKHPIDEKIATCILTGLINDTDHFCNTATTANSMSLASEMITKGARLHTIRKHLLQNKTVALLKLWGIALARLYYQPTQGAAITYLFQKDYEHFGLTEEEVYGIANFLNGLDEGKFTLFLKETSDGNVKGSLRTTRDDTDVSKIAQHFGGGGHKKAAGFTVPGRLEETVRGVRIIQK